MDIIAIIISAVSIIIAVISLVYTLRSQHLQNQVNKVDLELKKKDLDKKIEEQKKTICVEARVVHPSKDKYQMKVWNSGNSTAYNVVASINDDAQIIIFDEDKMPFEILEPGSGFELNLLLYFGSERKFTITTSWEDENGIRSSKEQLRDIQSN